MNSEFEILTKLIRSNSSYSLAPISQAFGQTSTDIGARKNGDQNKRCNPPTRKSSPPDTVTSRDYLKTTDLPPWLPKTQEH